MHTGLKKIKMFVQLLGAIFIFGSLIDATSISSEKSFNSHNRNQIDLISSVENPPRDDAFIANPIEERSVTNTNTPFLNATEEESEASTTEEGFEAYTTEEGSEVSTTEEGSEPSIMEEDSQVSTTEEGSETSIMEEESQVSTTEEGSKASIIEDWPEVSTTEDDFAAYTTEGFEANTTEEGSVAQPSEDRFLEFLPSLESQNTDMANAAQVLQTLTAGSFGNHQNLHYLTLFRTLLAQISQEIKQLNNMAKRRNAARPAIQSSESQSFLHKIRQFENEYREILQPLLSLKQEVQFLSDNAKKIRTENESMMNIMTNILSENQKFISLIKNFPDFHQKIQEIASMVEALKPTKK